MNLQQQKFRFEKNWKNFSTKLGTKKWTKEPNFCYFVEIPIPLNIQTEIREISNTIQDLAPTDEWITPADYHITIALPGRDGTHFKGNDVSFMKTEIEKILNDINPFEIQFGNLNCFSTVLYREVFDPTGQIYALHEKIGNIIPFSQTPAYQFDNFVPHISMLYANNNQSSLFKNPNFTRELSLETMLVKKIILGQAKDATGDYKRKVLKEFII